MISAKEVQVLNSQIESIHTEKTKAETKQEMLKKQLSEEIQSYKTQFGVNLEGKTVAETMKLIEAEVKKVTSEVEKEYNLKVKVVEAINRGDFEEAYDLLGIKSEAVEDGTDVEVEDVLEEALGEAEVGSEDDEDTAVVSESFLEAVEQAAKEKAEEEVEEMDMIVEDDDTEITMEEPKKPKSSAKKENMSSIADVFGAMEVDDDETNPILGDIDDTSFGFGESLKGTKYEVEE